MTATNADLNMIPKDVISECFQQWKYCWEKRVDSQGDYFEGDQVSSAQGMPVFFSTRRSDTFLIDIRST